MQEFDLSPLVGSWRIVSATVTWSDTRESFEPYGPSPVGYMILDRAGRVMFLFAKADRERPNSEGEKAASFDAMVAYTGKVRMRGPGCFVTTVDLAWNPGYCGDQLRMFELDGDQLKVWTLETKQPQFADRSLVAEVNWVREPATA